MRLSYFSYLLLFVIFYSFSLTSCNTEKKKEAAMEKRGEARPIAHVDGYIVQTRYVSESIDVPGSLVAEESTDIHPEISERITGLYIKEGAYVTKGTVLAKLYDADLQAQRKKLEVQLKIANQTSNRHEQLLKIGGISREDYETTTLQASNIKADLDIINTNIAKTIIRAPFNGKLGLKQVSIGAYVTPQTVITSIQKTTGLRIDFSVPEKYASQIKNGKSIHFNIGGSDKDYTAVVFATASGVEQNTRNLTIRARVKGDPAGLIPGGFAKVHLTFDANPNALMVPTQAIIPQARGKQIIVYKDGKAHFSDVVTGVRDSAMVEVTSGLKKGDTVITTGLMSLKPDVNVVVKNITKP